MAITFCRNCVASAQAGKAAMFNCVGSAADTQRRSAGRGYFLALSALNISKPSAGLRFLCTTACTALIIACGASDWKMLRPMSTRRRPAGRRCKPS